MHGTTQPEQRYISTSREFLVIKNIQAQTGIEDGIEKMYVLSGRLEMNPLVDISC